MVRAAVYTRISLDRNGEGLGVQRQVEDCRALARAKGWTVAAEFEDNDISAYSGKFRPGYERMLTAIDARDFDAVIVYNQDRLTRRPKEFEEFLERCMAGGVTLFSTCSGDTDLGQGDGILVARILAAASAHQSDATSRRIRRKNDERAAKGLPHSGGRRTFGYTADHLEVVEHEAAALRRAVARYIAGESVVSILRMFDKDGIATATGGGWKLSSLPRMLANPRYAGLVVRNGEVVGEGVWRAIITRQEHEQIVARRSRDGAYRPRAARVNLLAGMLRCGICGHSMVGQPSKHRSAVYRCNPGADTPGCGRMSIRAHIVEDLISRAVLTRLDTPALTRVSGTPDAEAEVASLTNELSALTRRLDELTDMWTVGEIDRRTWFRARGDLEDRIEGSRTRLGRLTADSALEALIGPATSIAEIWNDPDMTLQQRHAIIRAVIDRIIIHPAEFSGPRFDPKRVEPIWRA